MLNLISSLFASVADGFSGIETKATPLLFWADVEMPEELL